MQLQRNSSILLKQKNLREYLPPESTNIMRTFGMLRTNSFAQRNTTQKSEMNSNIKVRRHSSDLLLGRFGSNEYNSLVKIWPHIVTSNIIISYYIKLQSIWYESYQKTIKSENVTTVCPKTPAILFFWSLFGRNYI